MNRERRILLVEDMPDWQNEIKKILGDYKKNIITANTLEKARDLLKQHDYDLVLLDLRLEDWDEENFDGWELLDDIKLARRDSGTQVIIISAHGLTDHVRDGFKKYKIYDYVDKKKIIPGRLKFSVAEAIKMASKERGDTTDDQYSGA